MPVPEGSEPIIDRKGRMKLPFIDVDARPPEVRVRDFEPTFVIMTPEEAMEAAERCIQCPDPAACVGACPLHNDIPGAMLLIEQGDFIGAAEIYRKTSSMPEVCGNVCPHEALCQGACVMVKNSDPVLTGYLESFVMDFARDMGLVKIPVGESTGKKVAVVGAGPAGLGCAEQLVQKGHAVTIFESKPEAGGLLVYGIPNFKLPKDVVNNRIKDLMDAGVEFIYSTYIGKDKTIDQLLEDGYDAVFVGVGTQVDAPLKVEGADLPGVYPATEFLIRTNVRDHYLPQDMPPLTNIGNKVVVVGGGDTASDSLRSALRLGAEEVTCLYRRTEREMPGGKKDRTYAREEGARYQFLTQPIRFLSNDDGQLAAVECLRMELGEPDDSGRRRPVPVEGSNFIVEADTAVMALGYWPDPMIGDTTPDLETHNWGLIVTDPITGATTHPGVYAGGDAVTGPDLVVTAMYAGRQAAAAIDEYLK